MRITESQLRRMIRQEARALREGGAADKFKTAIAKKTQRKVAGSSEDQILATAAMDALTHGAEPYDVVYELMSDTFASDGHESAEHRAAYIIELVNDRDPVAGEALGRAVLAIERERADVEEFDRRY